MTNMTERNELHERLMLLKEYLETGKLKFAKDLKVIESLKKVKYS